MVFSLEALKAKQGDSLLLHFGDRASPKLILIDGGPGGVYGTTLRKRLDDIKTVRSPGQPLPIRAVMVSHIDDDHIHGVLDLTQDLVEKQDRATEPPYRVQSLWHNSFDDIIAQESNLLHSSLAAAAQAAATGSPLPAEVTLSLPGAVIMASVEQGRDLRLDAEKLSLNINQEWGKKLILAPKSGAKTVKMGTDLEVTVIGPNEDRLEALQEEWARQLKKIKKAQPKEAQALAAAFVDNSVFNLASIILLFKAGGRQMLLTGDARGDDILGGLKRLGLLRQGKFHVDLFKVPHHGSDRNISTDFFRQVTADHYVISGDGTNQNPEIATLEMLSDARGDEHVKVHLTYREDRLEKFYARAKAEGKNIEFIYRDDPDLSIRVDLDEKP
jgi:beta-lactamase superfamily II metal-dependent hydrolase